MWKHNNFHGEIKKNSSCEMIFLEIFFKLLFCIKSLHLEIIEEQTDSREAANSLKNFFHKNRKKNRSNEYENSIELQSQLLQLFVSSSMNFLLKTITNAIFSCYLNREKNVVNKK